MHLILQSLTLALGALGFVCALFLASAGCHYLKSPLRHLPGPSNASVLLGHMRQIRKEQPNVVLKRWLKQHGSVLTFTGFLGNRRLLTSDPKAITHVLHNAYDYPKPEATLYNLARMVGPGVLTAEGAHHRKQRKVMSPAFAPSHIKELTTTFLDKSIQLRDILASECASALNGELHTDAMPWLNRVTLDIIGLTGFNYKFDSLNTDGKPNELNTAFAEIFSTATSNLFRILQGWFPVLRVIPTAHGKQMTQAQATMSRIGYELLNESKEFSRASGGKENRQSRDLLSLLIGANTSTDIPESQRMSDEDVISQVPTFLVAGHETTAAAVTWALYTLTDKLETQRKLREEALSVSTDSPTLDELNALPYLDAVIRETLRLHSPVPSTIRVATKDDEIPVSKPYNDRYGLLRHSISVSKGDGVIIPIIIMNTDESVWGEDAETFRPERWEKMPETATVFPSVWGNIMSFLGGPRSCIGYRFSLAEIKTILFTLIRSFEFELDVPHEEIGRRVMIVQRPYLKKNPKKGATLPIVMRAISA